MIFSKEKSEDIRFRADLLECSEVALRAYQKTGNKKFWELCTWFMNRAKELQIFIQEGDYSGRDEGRWVVDNIINRNVI